MKISDEVRKIIWEARKKIQDLEFEKTEEGDIFEKFYRTNLTKRQRQVLYKASARLLVAYNATKSDFKRGLTKQVGLKHFEED